MSATRISFKGKDKRVFSRNLKQEVNQYFKENHISKHANSQMIVKTVVLLAVYFGAYGLIISNTFGLWGIAFLCFVMGIGMAGIGFSISHDALHGAYSRSEEHTSELQSRGHLVCRFLLEKKKNR